MCGIVGYIGKRNALPIVMDGLRRLEYRGYDSAGVALWDGERIKSERAVGKVNFLDDKLKKRSWSGTMAIAHTRWATHGKPSEKNAHPHSDCTKNIFLVHNGIIENFSSLKEALTREGHSFVSDTDTEVLAHLIERTFLAQGKNISLEDAVLEAIRHVTGTFGLAVVSSYAPGSLVAARRGSPLILGIGNEEYFVASDVSALVEHTKNVVYLHDNELAVLRPHGYEIMNLSKKNLKKSVDIIDWNVEDAQKNGFAHFMKKEIFEGPQTLENALRGRLLSKNEGVKLGGLEAVEAQLQDIKEIVIIACGTSYYAGLIGKHYFEEFARIPTRVEYASEFRYANSIINSSTAVIAISQSGETADTIEALREAKRHGALTLGVVNVVGSTIARETDAGVYNHAGPEIGVASTKAFISQIGVLMLVALFLGNKRNLSPVLSEKIIRELKGLPAKMQKIVMQDSAFERLAKKYLASRNFLYIGRKYQFPVALEGALKLKEISYKHAEGYAAGEMKHGPIALIDNQFPSIVLAPKDSVYEKTLSNLQELRARDAPMIVVATEGDASVSALADDVIFIPHAHESLAPFLSIIPLQFFAYHTAALLGLDVDKPRNLAKSVTVE